MKESKCRLRNRFNKKAKRGNLKAQIQLGDSTNIKTTIAVR